MKLAFGDIVVVDGKNIGVVVKCWIGKHPIYDVYVRLENAIRNFNEYDIERYMVRHKYLSEEELRYQHNAIHDK